jgi:hypothetical protein
MFAVSLSHDPVFSRSQLCFAVVSRRDGEPTVSESDVLLW